ncbi:hypothetical protein PHPALM_3600 [Phytophthora palmivora]|uniref:Uncharacterized protein n=1 Tax=Phytophthora palmivora TaxID=4796 RepID=A0A2P4YLZ4_9STRA|nr:hypothetical protein PHPALM_3600 [Phytophthora palmivora]
MSSLDHGSRDLAMELLLSPRRKTRTFESSLTRSLQAESEQKDDQVAKKAEVLNSKQAALRAQLEEQQKALVEQYQLMREAAETVGHQGRQIEDLKEEVLSPREQSR